ncbi:MAG TPA: P-II family nitrogen regulator [Terriglobales bacterium]|nr:P-II family nitrogen regulator [Terriglobales bacterium]
MKEIKAIIQPFQTSRVVDALRAMEGLPGITVSEVKGFGRNRARNAQEKVVEDFIEYAKKTKLEIVVPDELVVSVVETIQTSAHTGRPGDGLIFISAIDEVVRIRSGESQK